MERPASRPADILRVALIGEYPVAEDRIHAGGVQSVTHTLAHALARREDVECHVLCATRGVREPFRQVGDLRVHFVGRPPLPRLVTCHHHDVPRLLRVVRRIAPHVVHGQGQDRHGLAAVKSGLPRVVTPHGVIFVESHLLKKHRFDLIGSLKKHLLDGVEREVFRRSTDMIIISRYLPVAYREMLSARSHFIDNPVQAEFFALERAPQRGRLLFLGTVVPRKRVTDLVRAIAVLKEQEASRAASWLADLELRVVGPLVDPACEAEVQRLISEKDLADFVTLTGALSQEEVRQEYRRAEALVLASREETAPQVIAQAMACGLPIVSSAAGGVPYLVRDGETALLFPTGDFQACADRIARLIGNDDLRRQMTERIRVEAQQRFHPDTVAAQTVAVYRQVLAADSHR